MKIQISCLFHPQILFLTNNLSFIIKMVSLAKVNLRSEKQKLPKEYFDLIEKVGSKGKYQRNIFLIFALNWFLTALLIMEEVFMFMNPELICKQHGLLVQDCDKYVCEIQDKEIRDKFFDYDNALNTISTDLGGPYICQDSFTISLLQSTVFIGITCGYLFFMYFTDNYGRKTGVVLAWTVATIGIGILCASVTIWMSIIGLFLAGAGSESAIRITMAILGDVTDYNVRQKYSVALQIAFGSGGVLIALIYYLVGNWRIVNMFFILIPAIILQLLFIFYFEEAPKFLLNKSNKQALKALNRIGYINYGIKEILTQEDIENVRIEQVQDGDEFKKKVVTPIDLVRFKSLRLKSIGTFFLFFLINSIYFGPVFIVEELGFNVYLSQVIVGASQLLAYPISYFLVEDLPRKNTGIISFAIVGFFLGILVFFEKPKDCDGCVQSYVELICVFLARFTVSFYFSLFFLFATEVFPMRARAMGFGISSAAGAIGSSLTPIIFGILISLEITPMLYLTLCSLLAIAVLFFLPETQNKPLQIQIEEIIEEKKKIKQRRSSFMDSKLLSGISKKQK